MRYNDATREAGDRAENLPIVFYKFETFPSSFEHRKKNHK